MTSFARLLRALLFALVAAAGIATIQLVADDVCGNPLECFEPGQEGEIWQALTPFGETNDQVACENSLHPDPARIRPLARQCFYDDASGNSFGQLMPPKLGWMMDPFMLAVDGEKIYVSDQSNHRIQAFLFDGTPVPLAHPIGDGVPGAGPYPAYPADPRLTGHNDPITGVRLNSPDGIAVDGEGKLVVGDASGFVNVFNPDGSPAFGSIAAPERLQIPQPFGLATTATGIAVTPGTVVRGFGVAVPPGDTGRIVVTDRFMSFVFIYDSGFNLIKQIPEEIPEGAEANSACVWSETAPLGTFCTPVMAAIDHSGHIYVSEYDNNRIQVLDLDGNPISYFGTSDLAYPWGITLDHHGRLVVADTEAQRIAFFNLEYPSGNDQPPVATFQFELDAKGTLNGYPTAVIEQVGTGPGLDPAGRILVTDTLNNRVQRFQLPDLAIINPQLDIETGTGSFQVAVPAAKSAAVNFVGVSATGVNATVLTLNGVSPANTTPLNPADTALQNATSALGTTIAPGQVATYSFTFSAGASADVSFVFDAVGNGGATAAEPAEVNAAAPCVDCVSTHTIYERFTGSPTTTALANNGWFNKDLTVRINATSSHPSGLSAIAFQFLTGPESSSARWGGLVHSIPASGSEAFIDVDILSEGASSFRYWAVGGDGTVESSHFVNVALDLTAPNINYTLMPNANAAGWNNTTVHGTFTHADGRSGPVFTGVGNFTFADEGRGYFVEETATDKAGNVSAPIRSDYSGAGGRSVNIDKTAPIFDSVPTVDISIVATGDGFGVIPSSMNFFATATDPPLTDPRPGADLTPSGNVVINNPGTHQFPIGESTWTFTATDAAGNVSTAQPRKVTVTKAPGSIVYTGDLTVQYGKTLHLSANVGPSWATGQVTFTFVGDTGITSVISGGNAATDIAQVLKNVGTYTLTASYPGTASISGASTQVQITVTPAPITVRADNKQKVVAAVDPALTYSIVDGTLYGTDQFTGALTRTAGEMPGEYPILRGTLALSTNYALTFQPGTFTIAGIGVDVFADSRNKVYGDPDPVLTYSFSPALPPGVSFSGALSREPGEGRGNYTILVGSLALPEGFPLFYHSATFSITPREATVTAGNATKVFGTPDPEISVTSTGFLPTDAITISATRNPGENVGTYSTLAHAEGAALNNYTVGLQSGTFTITPAVVTVTPRPRAITYGDPEPVFEFDYGTFPAGYSAASVTTPPTCRVAAPHTNAGTYTITCSGGVTDGNVVFTYGTAQLAVGKRNATLTVNNETRAFGAENPTFSATTTGVVAGDTLNYTLTTTAIATSDIGSYPITATLGSNNNYNISVTNGTLTVEPATVVVTAQAKSKLYGQANPELTATVSGAPIGSTINYSLNTTAGTLSGVGSYPITVTLGSNPNFVVTKVDSTLTIDKLPITVTANALTKVYGDADPTLTFTTSTSLVGSDTFTGALQRVGGSTVGTYPIEQGTLALNGNYSITFVGANLQITKRTATLRANNAQKFVGQADPTFTTVETGFLGNDGVTFSATREAGETVGTYVITPAAHGAAVSNYTITIITGVFTIAVDNQPPVCTTAYGGQIWPPNHKKFYAAPINGVTDPDGGPITIVVTGIWQDEVIDSTGDGKFSPDGQGIGTSTAWVRAERNGHGNKMAGNGRVYEILFTATDNKGASCSGSVFYTVPHDQGQGSSAIDDGVRYDSTGVVPGARDKSQIHQKSPKP